MGEMLLVADLHLDDNPANEYRWDIFNKIKLHAGLARDIFILGDLADRADRHSARLVNRVVLELAELADRNLPVTILCGNHDKPTTGVPYWTFLNQLPYVTFVTSPFPIGDLILLPYSSDPMEDWRHIRFQDYTAVMMHQMVSGVVVQGRRLEAPWVLPFAPKNVVFSGDIHHPQTIGQVTYVGAPYPIKFGDDYKCRMLRLDHEYHVIEEIVLPAIRKDIIEITSLDQLPRLPPGSQVRVRLIMPAGAVEMWPQEEAAIARWATDCGTHLASTEAIIETAPTKNVSFDFDTNPEFVLRDFCRAEGVDDLIYQSGLRILQSVIRS